jgi:hypothetical protein
MLTHLMLYFATSVPSAIYLFYNFHWWHGLLHVIMQVYYTGPYTLMMHQHIHMRGILKKKFGWFDLSFPYITDPLMGHTWNSYYFHHVKHHHVESNGPNDLSSTVRYQRDDVWHFLHYVGRFYFLIWFDLPRYFLNKRKPDLALKAGTCEIANYIFLYTMYTKVNAGATFWVFLVPLAIMRLGLMIGNWAQHAFVDEVEPESDFRSSITLIDVPVRIILLCWVYYTKLMHFVEQPILLQRRLPHLASPQSPSSLARPSDSVPHPEEAVLGRTRTGLLQYRLPNGYIHFVTQELPTSGKMSSAYGRPDEDES